MAVAKNPIQVVWSAASSKSVAAGAAETSDAMALSAGAVGMAVLMKADNDGTPASGDYISWYASFTTGDPDGAGADEYPDILHAMPLGTGDTNQVDPALLFVSLPVGATGVKFIADNNSAGRAITASAEISEITA